MYGIKNEKQLSGDDGGRLKGERKDNRMVMRKIYRNDI